ncbi:MAG: redoxin family protein [Solobacterium sp.]|nr:redoxin family protein [Solobacterium sp.]
MGRTETYDNMGFRLTYPDAFDTARGLVMPMPVGSNNGVYLMMVTYMALNKEELETINNNTVAGQMSEADRIKVLKATGPILMVVGIDGGQGPEEIIKKMQMESNANAGQFTELARHEDITYYAVKDHNSEEAFLAKQDPVFAEEFHTLQDALIDALKNAEYFKPRLPGADLIGRKISFETKDIDGNPVKSEELFASHAVTMINLWATWCGPCKSELEELGNIHRRLAEKDAAIVGICTDADEKAEECRELMAKNNMTYINLLPYPELDAQMPTRGIPTSFFVSRDGKIMTYPIVGVPSDISEYEKTVDKMLAKAAAGYDPTAQKGTTENKKDSCRIVVKDEAGNPVEGVTVQFCTDTTCMIGKTDAEGIASFTVDHDQYTVHIQKVPEGYASCTEEVPVPEDRSDVEFTLKKL